MNKLLLLTIAAISVASIQAQPVAKNYILLANEEAPAFTGAHVTDPSILAEGGVPPYTFAGAQQEINGTLDYMLPNGDFAFNVVNYPASFQFTVTDSNGNVSQPGTITITLPEKG